MQEPIVTGSEDSGMNTFGISRSAFLSQLMLSLVGSWKITRNLQSESSSEPSGLCSGTAVFTSRTPSPYLDESGKLHLASIELVYHEQGEFELTSTNSGAHIPKYTFSRKYVWRLGSDKEAPDLSIWFVKPGTEFLDYLFHTVDIPIDSTFGKSGCSRVQGMGGHLCVEDYYSSSYEFEIIAHRASVDSEPKISVTILTIEHEVRGPTKEQTITTTFTRR